MKVIYYEDFNVFAIKEGICAALGNFDGVHLGHQKLIEETKKHGYKSAVITFFPHPFFYLKNIRRYSLLSPIEEKIDLISCFEIDYLIIIGFNEKTAIKSKEEFMAMLKQLNVKMVVVGEDYHFAKHASGNAYDLAHNFNTKIISKVEIDNIRISSTYIKELLSDGNIVYANKLLNRPYEIVGRVIHGNKMGRTIGYPTANIDYGYHYLPKIGVYKGLVQYKNKEYKAMINIGNNPTFNYVEDIRMEVNIIGFNGNIYGETLKVSFLDFIRGEKKFNSKDELIAQLQLDAFISQN